jgi:hypothetical protein
MDQNSRTRSEDVQYWTLGMRYFAVYVPIVPDVSVPFPSTVLFPRESRSAREPRLRRPMPLSVAVELDTLTVAIPVELVTAKIQEPTLFEAMQLSIFTSTAAAESERAEKP